MIFDLSFKADWAEIRNRKITAMKRNNAQENRKRVKHTYHVGDLVLKDRNIKQSKLHRPRDGPYEVTAVYENGTVRIRKGSVTEKLSIRRVSPYRS